MHRMQKGVLYRVGYALGEVAKNADNVGLDPAYLVETVKLQKEMAGLHFIA